MKEFFFKIQGFFQHFFEKIQQKPKRRGKHIQNMEKKATRPRQKTPDPTPGEREIDPHTQQQEEQHEQPQPPAAGARAEAEKQRRGQQAVEQVQQRGQELPTGPGQGEEIVDQPRRQPRQQRKPRLPQLQQRGRIDHPKRREKRPPRSARPSS